MTSKEVKLEWLLDCIDKSQIMNFFTKEQRREIAKEMEYHTAKSGDTIITQDSRDTEHFYILDAGEIDVYIFEHKIRTLKTGDNFGELGFAFGCPRSATCRMTQDGSFWVLHHDLFQKSIAKHLKLEGVFLINRQHSDIDPNPDNADQKVTDMDIIEEAGMKESFVDANSAISPRIVPGQFMRRLSEQNYVSMTPEVKEHVERFMEEQSHAEVYNLDTASELNFPNQTADEKSSALEPQESS